MLNLTYVCFDFTGFRSFVQVNVWLCRSAMHPFCLPTPSTWTSEIYFQCSFSRKKMCVHIFWLSFSITILSFGGKRISVYIIRERTRSFQLKDRHLSSKEQHMSHRPLLLFNNLSTNYNNYIRHRSKNYDDGHWLGRPRRNDESQEQLFFSIHGE